MTKIIANYLPQYHAIPENDEWWGKGYTDWIAVKNCKKVFPEHSQPKVPLNGYYDLSLVDNIKFQAKLARKYGIYGFGIYHYWFSSEQVLLTKPAQIIRDNKDIDINYMFIWDNGSWKRSWSNVKGHANDWAPIYESNRQQHDSKGILAELQYGGIDEWKKHFKWLLTYFKDSRYIKVNNCPVFVVFHQDSHLFLLKSMFFYWDIWAKKEGFNGVYFIGQRNTMNISITNEVFNYEPAWSGWMHNSYKKIIANKLFPSLNQRHLYEYDQIWEEIVRNARKIKRKQVNLGAFVGYDDSPRRGEKGKIVLGATPEKFERYFSQIMKISTESNKKFVFLTAWNEWGEGAYLEPDNEFGYAYLEAVKHVVDEYCDNNSLSELKCN